MKKDQSKLSVGVDAMAEDGTTYRIERRSSSLPGDDHGQSYFYCCLADGEIVMWLGGGYYQLPNGTVVHTMPFHLIPK